MKIETKYWVRDVSFIDPIEAVRYEMDLYPELIDSLKTYIHMYDKRYQAELDGRMPMVEYTLDDWLNQNGFTIHHYYWYCEQFEAERMEMWYN